MRPAGFPAMEMSKKALEVMMGDEEQGEGEGMAVDMEGNGREESDRARARRRERGAKMIGEEGNGGGVGGISG